MEVAEAQRQVRSIYMGGFAGQLIIGTLWLASAALATWVSLRIGAVVLVVGGFFIYPVLKLVKAGIMLAGDGLHPSSKGARVKFSDGKQIVTDGPFPETDQLVAGFWIWRVKSKEEAIEWLKRAPFGGGVEIELRQIFEAEDFGKQLTPELREREARLRAEVEERAKAAQL